MRREDVESFARRDWQAVADCKDLHWLEERRRRGLVWCLRMADELRRQVTGRHAEWPSAEERELDLDAHVRVGEALRRVHRTGRG